MFPKVKNVNVESPKKRSKLLIFFGETPPTFLSMNAHEWIHEWFLNVNRAKYTHQTKNRKAKGGDATRITTTGNTFAPFVLSAFKNHSLISFLSAFKNRMHRCCAGFCA